MFIIIQNQILSCLFFNHFLYQHCNTDLYILQGDYIDVFLCVIPQYNLSTNDHHDGDGGPLASSKQDDTGP